MVGSSRVEVKLFGPVHEKVVPMSVVPDNCKVCPRQPWLELAEAVGVGFCVTFTFAVAWLPQPSWITTDQVPTILAAMVAVGLGPVTTLFGFVQVKVYGPLPPRGTAVSVTVLP